MKKIVLLLTLCCALIACKKTDVNFSYSPEAPRAGQIVKFSNLSSSGEDWAWTFGDGSTSTLKNPSHVYKRPGTYLVALQVDKKKSLRISKEITVYDTIPTFVCEDSVFYIFKDYVFTANVYNPYNYTIDYEWTTDGVITSMTDNTITCYFTEPDEKAEVRLQVVMNGDTTIIEKQLFIADVQTNSIYLRTPEGDYRQRIFGNRAEEPQLYLGEESILDFEQDTIQTYNGKVFRLSELAAYIPEIQGFHIINRKIYYRADGLWVALIDGTYPVQIDESTCNSMTLDTHDNRIYWANDEGVWYMPFIGSDNNKFVTVPTLLNDMTDVTCIASEYPVPNQ